MWQAPSPCALPLRCPAGLRYLEGGILKVLTVVCHMALLQPALSLGRVSGTAGLRYGGEGGEASTYSFMVIFLDIFIRGFLTIMSRVECRLRALYMCHGAGLRIHRHGAVLHLAPRQPLLGQRRCVYSLMAPDPFRWGHVVEGHM